MIGAAKSRIFGCCIVLSKVNRPRLAACSYRWGEVTGGERGANRPMSRGRLNVPGTWIGA